MIDLHQKSNESEIERLSEQHLSRPIKRKELPMIPVDTPILYEKNPDSSKTKCPKWSKDMISYRSNPRKYQIFMDRDRIVTRSRCHIRSYFIHSGREIRPPNRLSES